MMMLLLDARLTWETLETLLVVLAIIAVPFAVAGLIDDLIQKRGERRERDRQIQADVDRAAARPGQLDAIGRTVHAPLPDGEVDR